MVGKANTGSLLKSVVVSKGEKHKGLKKTSLIVNHRTQRKSEEKLAVKTKQTKPTFVFRNIRIRKLARGCGAKRQLGYKRCKESKVRLLQIQNKTKKAKRLLKKSIYHGEAWGVQHSQFMKNVSKEEYQTEVPVQKAMEQINK